jgi:hypothetical protein
MNAVAQGLRDVGQGSALGAGLRRVLGRHSDYPDTGAFCLVFEDAQECRPADIISGLRERAADDALHAQVLDGNRAVGVNQAEGDLVVEVAALVSNVLLKTGDDSPSLAAATAAPLAAGNSALRSSQGGFGLTVELRRRNAITLGRDEEALQAEVDADRRILGRRDLDLTEVAGEDRVPVARLAPERNRLDLSFDRTVQLDLDVTDVLEVDTRRGFIQFAAVAVGGELDGVEAIGALVG